MLPIDRLPVCLLDAHELGDEALMRLAVGASSVLVVSTAGRSAADAERWRRLVPDIPVTDGGAVADVREAMTTAAGRQILVVATGAPANAARWAGRVVQGAAAATQVDVPAMAVHVLRDTTTDGPVAWLSQSGALSGYGELFAIGFAQLHDRDVVLVEPAGGLSEPRSPEVHESAMAAAARAGVRVSTLSDPSPLERALRDRYSVVVQPILDVPGGRALLHPGELPASSLAGGNPAAFVQLLERHEGDVVAVLDGVRLVGGDSRAVQAAAAAVIGVVAVAGVGLMSAAPAFAAAGPAATASAGTDAASVAGVTVTASGHNGASHTGTFQVLNRLDGPVTLQLVATWVHSGNHPPIQVPGATVTVPGGTTAPVSFEAPRPTGTGHGGYHVGSWQVVMRDSHGHELLRIPTGPGAQLPPVVQSPLVAPSLLSPQFRPPVTQPQVTQTPEMQTPETQTPGTQTPTRPPQTDAPARTPDRPPLTTPTAIPTAIPQATHHMDVPTATPTLPPTQTPTAVPTAIPTATPHTDVPTATPALPPTQTPTQTPTAIPPKAPQQVPPLTVDPQVPPLTQVVEPPTTVPPQVTPVVGPTQIAVPPETTYVTSTQTPGPTKTPEVTETPEVTKPPAVTKTPTTTTTPNGTRTPTTTTTTQHRTPTSTGTGTTSDGPQLAHTGAESTGLLAGIAAALLAAGAGLVVAGRERTDEEPED